MPRTMDENDNVLYRVRYTLIYPLQEGSPGPPNSFTQYFGPYRTLGTAKSAIKSEDKSHDLRYLERNGTKIDAEIEVADITWRPYHD